MRILVDMASHVTGNPAVTQVEKTPEGELFGTPTPINGKYLVPVPMGEFQVTNTDYVLPIDGGDLSSKSYALLLAHYPMYGHIYFNPLLTPNNLDELDYLATFLVTPTLPLVPYTLPSRFQMGLPASFPITGQAPTMTAVLPINTACTPNHPGMLITQEIDITIPTGGVGADEFMVYWKLYDFTTQHDVRNDVTNDPAVKLVTEMDPDASDFSVYLSPDNGVHWVEVDFLTPVAFGAKTTKFRVAFRNDATSKRYLASFAVMF